MPRNQNGQYFLPDGNPVTPGELITSDWANTTLDDVAAGLSGSLDRNGAGGMKAPLKLIDGTVNNPSLSFSSEGSTGVYLKSTGVMGVSVMGTEVAEIGKNGMTLMAGTGIVIPDAPTADNQAANKAYVDAAIAAAVAKYLPLTGGVVTGDIRSLGSLIANGNLLSNGDVYAFWGG